MDKETADQIREFFLPLFQAERVSLENAKEAVHLAYLDVKEERKAKERRMQDALGEGWDK